MLIQIFTTSNARIYERMSIFRLLSMIMIFDMFYARYCRLDNSFADYIHGTA